MLLVSYFIFLFFSFFLILYCVFVMVRNGLYRIRHMEKSDGIYTKNSHSYHIIVIRYFLVMCCTVFLLLVIVFYSLLFRLFRSRSRSHFIPFSLIPSFMLDSKNFSNTLHSYVPFIV